MARRKKQPSLTLLFRFRGHRRAVQRTCRPGTGSFLLPCRFTPALKPPLRERGRSSKRFISARRRLSDRRRDRFLCLRAPSGGKSQGMSLFLPTVVSQAMPLQNVPALSADEGTPHSTSLENLSVKMSCSSRFVIIYGRYPAVRIGGYGI